MKTLTSLLALHDVFWAIESRAGRQLWHALSGMSIEVHARDVEARGGMAERPGERDFAFDDGLAIISIVGPMTKAVTSLDDGCSTVAVRRQIRAAADDPEVKGIMLRVYSPGGSVAGTEALAADVAAAGRRKPVMGYAEDLCCSAALWVLSQCGTAVANATALVGSIGTYCVVYDCSAMYEMMGVKAHLITTGENKGAGVPGAPITPEQLASFQREVDDLNAHFLGAVSKGRKLPISEVKKLASGDVWIAAEAKSHGLLDGVGSFDQAMSDLRASAGGSKPAAKAEDGRFETALSAELSQTPVSVETIAEPAAESVEVSGASEDPSVAPDPTTDLATADTAGAAGATQADRDSLRRLVLGSLLVL